MVIQCRQLDAAVGILHWQRREIDLGVEEVVDQVAQDVGIHQLLDLGGEVELGEDFLHVRREAVQVCNEVIAQPLPRRAGLQLGQGELRDVVERLACCHAQRAVLLGAVTSALLWELSRHVLVWYFATLSQIGTVYGSLTTAIAVLLSLEIAATLLLLGAQVIAEYERTGDCDPSARPEPFTTEEV